MKEMKPRNFLLCLSLLLAATLNAQTILKGDMNNDQQVTIADVTSLVNVLLGKTSQESICVSDNPYKVDNSLVIGTWIAPDNSSLTLNEDGTTTYNNASTYKFRPFQGVLTLYDTTNTPIKAIVLNEVTEDYLIEADYANNRFIKYTKNLNAQEEPNLYGYYDLGLPSGTLWATCNIGGSSPEEYGDSFAWGETEGRNSGKSTYDWSSYKWCKGKYNTLTKYCSNSIYGYDSFIDDKTELDLEDDAAYVNLGPNWRIPSLEQFRELIWGKYTTIKWINMNGCEGLKITSKKNGNSIFLPVDRSRDDLAWGDAVGQYWTRSLDTTPSNANCFSFSSDESQTRTELERFEGCCIRPVYVPE